jgi:hypothetical protein
VITKASEQAIAAACTKCISYYYWRNRNKVLDNDPYPIHIHEATTFCRFISRNIKADRPVSTWNAK